MNDLGCYYPLSSIGNAESASATSVGVVSSITSVVAVVMSTSVRLSVTVVLVVSATTVSYRLCVVAVDCFATTIVVAEYFLYINGTSA